MIKFNTDQAYTDLWNKYGAFFAFSEKQFNEGQKEGIKYCSLGCGLTAPVESAKAVIDGMRDIDKQRIAFELANNTKKDLIWYQLANHEAQISGDYSEAHSALECYGITKEEVEKEYREYFDMCVENDYF